MAEAATQKPEETKKEQTKAEESDEDIPELEAADTSAGLFNFFPLCYAFLGIRITP
jgi:hypothetical protein